MPDETSSLNQLWFTLFSRAATTTQIFRLENPEGMRRKCRTLSKWIGEAKHVVIFTGPGISVSAGIPDNVKPGVPESTGGSKIAKAVPTVAHMGLAKLATQQAVDYIITTCLDGLHAKAGTPASSLSELHGNHFQEFCTKCGRSSLTPHPRRRRDHPSHRAELSMAVSQDVHSGP